MTILSRFRAILAKLRSLKSSARPKVGRYGVPEDAYWRPPIERRRSFLQPRPGWIETRRDPGDDYGPNAGLF